MNNALRQVAKKVVWFDEPDKTLADKRLFLSYLMTYGGTADIVIARRFYSDADFIAVLKDPMIGVFDGRSWHYWHNAFGLPIPELPKRKFE